MVNKEIQMANKVSTHFIRAVIVVLGFFYTASIFRARIFLYTSYFDDFYYYLKIAENFYNGYGSSFMKGVKTNGYQPFYQWFICGLLYLSKLINVDALTFIRPMLSLIFIFFSFNLLKLIKPHTFLSSIIFVSGICGYFLISYNGMESLFAIPLLAILIIRIVKDDISIYGVAFYSIICFFVRIDSILIVMPVLFCYGMKKKLFSAQNFLQTFLAGLIIMIPFLAYIIYNYYQFYVLFPISGLAKSVIKFSGVHKATFTSFFIRGRSFTSVIVLSILIALIIVLLRQRKTSLYLVFFVSGIFLFYFQNAVRSDWGIWVWYFYPFPVLLIVSANEANTLNFEDRFFLKKIAIGISLLSTATFLYFSFILSFPNQPEIIMTAGTEIQQFEKQNKGVYAMGDRAGIVGYLLESPVVQLEGLVMDKEFLENLKNRKKLIDLILPYHVEYYIATNPGKINDSTYLVSEPSQSNGFSSKIVDTISWKVKFEFSKSFRYKFSKDIQHTVIFEVPKNGKIKDAKI